MGKKPREWSPDGLKYLMIINPFAWQNPPDGNSRDIAPGHLVAWVNHALGHHEGDSVVQELAWRAKTGTREAILVGIDESVDIKGLLGEHRWSEFCSNVTRPDSSCVFETRYGSLVQACGADSWKRVERDLRPASVGNMFEKPYPRPRWADSREKCAGMNVQLSSQVKPIQALPQPKPLGIKPDPSVSQPPLVSASVFGTLETGNNPQRPSHPTYTGSMPQIAAQTSEMAQRDYSSSRGVSSQGPFYVKQELSENLVHPAVVVPGSIPALPKPSLTQAPFSGQSGNRISVPPHGAAHASTSVSSAPGSGRDDKVSLKLGPTAEIPAPSIKLEASSGPEASVERARAAWAAYLDRRSTNLASIPTAPIIRSPSPSTRSAQQPSSAPFPTDVYPLSNAPEAPTTDVKAEPLEHTFEPVSLNPLDHVVSGNLSLSGVSLPDAMYEHTATLPSSSITRPGPLSGPEQFNRFSAKAALGVPLTNLAPRVAGSGTPPLTDRQSQPLGTSINDTALPSLKRESGIDNRSAIRDLLTSSSALNKRKGSSTNDRDRQSKRAKLAGGSR